MPIKEISLHKEGQMHPVEKVENSDFLMWILSILFIFNSLDYSLKIFKKVNAQL